MFTLTIHHIKELENAAQQLLNAFPKDRVFLLNGQMGAGKTTFIKAICKVLGVSDGMSSPTYSIVNEYAGTSGIIYHFDLYRLNSTEECFDIGFEEYVNSGHYCFIEWPEVAKPLLPEQFVEAELRTEGETRLLHAKQNMHGI